MMDGPKRIQRQRAKGWRIPDGAVFVGPGSSWANPHKIGKAGPEQAVAAFEADLARENLPYNECDIYDELRGKDLVCWCRDGNPCHADVLLRVANGIPPFGMATYPYEISDDLWEWLDSAKAPHHVRAELAVLDCDRQFGRLLHCEASELQTFVGAIERLRDYAAWRGGYLPGVDEQVRVAADACMSVANVLIASRDEKIRGEPK